MPSGFLVAACWPGIVFVNSSHIGGGCFAHKTGRACDRSRIILRPQKLYFSQCCQRENIFLSTTAARVLQSLNQMKTWVAKPELSQDAAEWLGDAHPLVAQLGLADGLVSLSEMSESLAVPPVKSLEALGKFLRRYHSQVLLPLELTAIRQAHTHAASNHTRELIAFDQQLFGERMLRDFANASRRIGQAQLQLLRPLRDERLVQRYLSAVDRGDAHGWHTLVYGLTLVVYSLPLRQGLLGYAQQTTRGFIHSAARSLKLTEADCRQLFEELCAPLPGVVDSLVGDFTN